MNRHPYIRILAIDPCTRGFGFVVLEGRMRLLDWGVASVWAKSDREFLARVECLVERYAPKVLVLEDVPAEERFQRRIRRIRSTADYAKANRMKVLMISKGSVRGFFGEAGGTKYLIAQAISTLFPELRPHLPPVRKPWMPEDQRMNIFDAAGLVVAAYHKTTASKPAPLLLEALRVDQK